MKTALIGYTGFVGSNIAKQNKFSDYYNSQNIEGIKNTSYDLIISAANSSLMWKANLEPEKDWENIKHFMDIIKTTNAKHFVLLSTIEVYDNPIDVTEDSIIKESLLKPYGKNRLKLERFIKKQFKNHTIIRMPNLFGGNLKKNFVYDLIHNNHLDYTHKDNQQQWYYLKNIWKDIETAIKNDFGTANFSVEPISCEELARYTLGMDFTTVTNTPARIYNMLTKYSHYYHSSTGYLYNKKETLKNLKTFIQKEIKSL